MLTFLHGIIDSKKEPLFLRARQLNQPFQATIWFWNWFKLQHIIGKFLFEPLYSVTQVPQFLALGLFLPLGITSAVIICQFLAFLAVCDAAQRKSNVLTPTAVHLWAQPPIKREERERQSSLTVRKGWVIAKNDLLCHVFAKQSAPCSPKSHSLQREATASEGTFRLFIHFLLRCLSQRIRL